MAQDDSIARLARQIDATDRSERMLTDRDRIGLLRRQGAVELHRICATFVASVNERLSGAVLELAPQEYSVEAFRDSGANLLQIGSLGRQMQIAFESTPSLTSTERFPVPYVLEGEIRTFNQKMLEHFDIRTRMIFFCLERDSAVWRFFDWRTRATGALTVELLVNLLEPLF